MRQYNWSYLTILVGFGLVFMLISVFGCAPSHEVDSNPPSRPVEVIPVPIPNQGSLQRAACLVGLLDGVIFQSIIDGKKVQKDIQMTAASICAQEYP